MDSISSLASARNIRPVVEAAAVAVLAVCGISLIWRYGGRSESALIGIAAAWTASSASVIWLMTAQQKSSRAFWRAFGGGMALRAAVLAGLVVLGLNMPGLSLPALLLSYVFGILGLSILEFRHIK